MKKTILVLTSALLLASCNNGSGGANPSNQTSKQSWTISFNSNGGSEVASIKVEDGQKASKPADPAKEGYSFDGWYSDAVLATVFDWNISITSNWTLYASWEKAEVPGPDSGDSSSKGDDDSSTGSDDTSSSDSDADSDSSAGDDSSGGTSDAKGHGPEGSTLASWYLVGSGSLWDESNGWTVAGGVQLFTNPNNLQDKGCLLEVSFAVGDIFKVTDGGTTWFGYENVNQATDGEVPNAGVTSFEGVADGYGGQNIKCKEAGKYDVYVNPQGVFWIQASN